jgi:hypothetical protein
MTRSSRVTTYGVPTATIKKLAKRALFFQRLLIILGVNSTVVAKSLRVTANTTRSWRQMEESIPPDTFRVLIEAYFDYTDSPSKTWATFAAALDRRAQAARLPGFGESCA